jgi:hypothetical protein
MLVEGYFIAFYDIQRTSFTSMVAAVIFGLAPCQALPELRLMYLLTSEYVLYLVRGQLWA